MGSCVSHRLVREQFPIDPACGGGTDLSHFVTGCLHLIIFTRSSQDFMNPSLYQD